MTFKVTVNPVHEEFAARLGKAGVDGDAERIDAILDEISDAGLEAALAVLAVQTRSLVLMLMMLRGPDETRELFEKTIIDAGKAVDDDA